jgi:hypothetical protein
MRRLARYVATEDIFLAKLAPISCREAVPKLTGNGHVEVRAQTVKQRIKNGVGLLTDKQIEKSLSVG